MPGQTAEVLNAISIRKQQIYASLKIYGQYCSYFLTTLAQKTTINWGTWYLLNSQWTNAVMQGPGPVVLPTACLADEVLIRGNMNDRWQYADKISTPIFLLVCWSRKEAGAENLASSQASSPVISHGVVVRLAEQLPLWARDQAVMGPIPQTGLLPLIATHFVHGTSKQGL